MTALTPRLHIAAMCLQGLLHDSGAYDCTKPQLAQEAVKYADALLAECGEGESKTPISDATAEKFGIGNTYTIEPHGDGYALYRGRGEHHGMNLAHITEALPETLNLIANALNQPRKVEREYISGTHMDYIVAAVHRFDELHQSRDILQHDLNDILNRTVPTQPRKVEVTDEMMERYMNGDESQFVFKRDWIDYIINGGDA